jgi:lipopolysaccharide export system protein LptA
MSRTKTLGRLLLGGLLLGGMWVPAAMAAEKPAPIRIEADRMEASQKEESVIFSGKVEASQKGLIIQADEMTVFYERPPEAGATVDVARQQVSRLKARGNVRINREGWIASGDALEFFSEKRQVVLTGHTTVFQKDNKVTGDRIILYLDEGRSVVERESEGGERVKGVFFPESGQ